MLSCRWRVRSVVVIVASIDRTVSVTVQEQLWRLHAADLLRFATLLVGPNDAADIVSAVFIRASKQFATNTVEQPRPYLFRAVSNGAHDLRRRNTNRWRRDLLAVSAAAAPVLDNHVDVRRAVAALSVRQRSVIYLAYWEDMTERQIAELLGLSPGAVQRHLGRARVHLRKALND